MGEYLRKCEKIREMNKVMRNREDVEEILMMSCLSSGKRRKFDDVSVDVNVTENSTSSPATSVTSSQCSSCYETGEVMKNNLKSLDLKAEGFETDNISASFNGAFSGSYKRIEENCGDSEEMETSSTTTTKKSVSSASVHRKQPSAGKIPPQAEIEEFLSAAEKREERRFAEKYNYDIVKDVPLEGHYQWVSLKP